MSIGYNRAMLNRKVTYRLYPNIEKEIRLRGALGLHQRLYNIQTGGGR